MRLIIVLLVGVVVGWIAGNLYPAPQAWFAVLHPDALEGRLSDDAQPQRGAMAGILRFYQTVFAAPTAVESDAQGELGRVKIGRHQALLFRETDRPLRPYDGHHVAVYVANFSAPYGFLKSRGAISEDVRNHQFRFKEISDPVDGSGKFLLEHEVRSLRHPMYNRFFVNRDVNQTQRAYRRGWDAYTPYVK